MKGEEGIRSPRSRKRPVGGKALSRLNEQELQRGLELTTVVPKKPSAARSRRLAAAAAPPGPQAAPSSPYLRAVHHLEDATAAEAAPVRVGWRPIGPFAIPHGQTYGSGQGSRPSVSGRISSVAVDPSDEDHLLIGSAGGGVWETRDRGQTWDPRTDDQASLAIGAITFDPNDPTVVYCGTGEGDSFAYLGTGLLRSQDGGTTWNRIAETPFVLPDRGTGFYELLVEDGDGDHLLAATTEGIYEHTLGSGWREQKSGRTWDLSWHPPEESAPDSTHEVFAGCYNGLFRSTKKGQDWKKVTLPGAPRFGWVRIEVCHAPSDGNVVYVFAAGYKSQADANNFKATVYLWRRGVYAQGFKSFKGPKVDPGQANYDWCAAVAPNNPAVFYVGAIDVHRGVRSTTGNWSWETISARDVGDSIHPDQHAIVFGPNDPNTLYIGNDGGIYCSPDAGVTWKSLNNGLAITEMEYMAQHPEHEAWLLAGTQDNGTQRYEGNEVWFHVSDGDGGDCGVHPNSPYTCHHTRFWHPMYTDGLGVLRSTSGGGWNSWTWIPLDTEFALFYPPLEIHDSVIARAGNRVYLSRRKGTAGSWDHVELPTYVQGGAAYYQAGCALAIPDSETVYVATTVGNVYRIDYRNGAWQPPVALTRPSRGHVSDMIVDPADPERIWVTYSSTANGRVYRSPDAGSSWDDVGAGLPEIAINAIVLDPDNTQTAYVGADVGVWRSRHDGDPWTPFSHLLPNVLVKDLLFHGPSRLLRAATQSRGVWEIAVDQDTMPAVEIYVRDSVVDTGRLSPSPSDAEDPFAKGSRTYWWQCTDLKVDAPPYRTPVLDDMSALIFEDDHGVFASGLFHDSAQKNRRARIYVQVHNRGAESAANVTVRVFYSAAAISFPDLPDGFWDAFPDGSLPAGAPWQPAGPKRTLPLVETAKPQVVGFEWDVPDTISGQISLLTVISAESDPIGETTLNVADLVRHSKKCGLKNVATVNPDPVVGPFLNAVRLNVRDSARAARYTLEADSKARSMVRGIVLPKRLAEVARKAKLPRVRLGDEDRAAIFRLTRDLEDAAKTLDLSTAYQFSKSAPILADLKLKRREEPVIVLLDPKARAGQGSLVQRAPDGAPTGGFTFHVEKK